MIYAKLIGGFAILMALVWGGLAYTDSVKKSQKDADQLVMDSFKASIQKTTDQAIATATKERDDALEANQVIHDNYEKQLSLASADSAQFASRLRAAEARLTASNQRPLSAGGAGSGDVSYSGSDSAQQLGQLVTLVTQLRAECIRNDDALDALYASVNQQPHTVQ